MAKKSTMKMMSDINVHLENKRESRIFFVFIWIMYSLVYTTKACFSAALVFIKQEGILTLTEVSFILAITLKSKQRGWLKKPT